MVRREFCFSRGNLKLDKRILIWNLPAIKTCPGASTACKSYCYALKAERVYPSARHSREKNLLFSKREDFVQQIVSYLEKRPETIVRLHESGDFYSQHYLEAWKAIARSLPSKTFYAYTKSYYMPHFWDNMPDNMRIIQSVESRFPHMVDWNRSTARVIERKEERLPFEFICPEQLAKRLGRQLKCGECSLCWTLPVVHVCFLKH